MFGPRQLSTVSYLTITWKTSTNQITNQYWVSSSAWSYKGYGHEMAMFSTLAEVRTRKIDRTSVTVLPCDFTLSLLAILASK